MLSSFTPSLPPHAFVHRTHLSILEFLTRPHPPLNGVVYRTHLPIPDPVRCHPAESVFQDLKEKKKKKNKGKLDLDLPSLDSCIRVWAQHTLL